MDNATVMKLLAIGLYVAILIGIGVAASRKVSDIRDYFAAGKKLGFFNVAFSARATGESAWLLLGLTGMGYAIGVKAFWVVVGEMIGVGGAWLFMAHRFKRLTDRYDSITVPDYLESRLREPGNGLRLIAAGALIVFVPIYAGAQVFATGNAFHDFFGWNHYLGAAAGFAVVMLYITQGGFTAVVWSDVFQGSLMVIGLVALPIVAWNHAGGLEAITDGLRAIDPDLLTWHGPGAGDPGSGGWDFATITSILGLAAIGIGFWGSPQVFVRYISMKNTGQILPGTVTALIWTLLADSGAVLVGIFGRVIYTPAALDGNAATAVSYSAGDIGRVSENILPEMSLDLLPAFLAGGFIAMVLSAIMSTIDSLLVVASSAGVRDYWQKTRDPNMSDERLMTLSRRVTLALSLVSFGVGIGIMLYDKDNGVFWAIMFGWSGIAATFCPTMILSLYWSGLTARGAKFAMAAGFLAVPLFKFAAPAVLISLDLKGWSDRLNDLDVLLPSFLVGFLVAIVVSAMDKAGRARLIGIKAELDEARK